MNLRKLLQKKRSRRLTRNRARISGTAARPRLAVFRSNSAIYAQLIDDDRACTVVSAASREVAKSGGKKSKTELAVLTGERLAKKAAEKGIKTAVFDRRAYKYHGRVRALAEAARGAGLKI